MTPSDNHFSTKLKDFLPGECLQSDYDLKKGVQHWLVNSIAEVYKEDMQISFKLRQMS